MTQDNVFVQAIIDSLDDDTRRLVYADWLDEHGQPEYARFIRLQIPLHGLNLHAPSLNRKRAELEEAWAACLRARFSWRYTPGNPTSTKQSSCACFVRRSYRPMMTS